MGGPEPEPSPTPDEAADGDLDVRRGERVEIRRDDSEVLFAWVDDDGLATSSLAIVAVDGGWVTGETLHCRD